MNLTRPSEQSIFLSALELPTPAEREAYLRGVCGGDEDLRRAVAELLAAHERANPLDAPPVAPPATIGLPAAEAPGTMVGSYKLLQVIGEGGMGMVWLAEQTSPVQRKVALKIIRPGLDSKQVLARFEQERQALALMDHPHIAKVLDGGAAPDGRPYFVMELVQGIPITAFCDLRRLTPRERLELMVPVCQAVQHAHHKGIIHRDLKPSNVLVALYDGVPVPKVIDFGVAKAAEPPPTEQSLHTGFGTVVGTPEYMSPEQAGLNQLDVDARSDIYSLGVLLYELLTGSPPFGRQDLATPDLLEMLRVIREQEPTRPSTRLSTAEGLPTLAANRGTEPAKLTRLVRGELDWIVMKALEKDRNRRYDTANALAMDLQRYLHDEPVLACPPSAGYRLRKFVRRNRRSVLAAGLILLALVGGTVGTAWQAVEAERERGRAIEERNAKQRALEAETAALQQAMAALRNLTDDVVKRQLAQQLTLSEADRAFLKKVVAHYEALADLKGETPESRAVQAEGHSRVGWLRYTLGELAEGRASLERARELYERLAADFPAVPEYRLGLAGTHNELGNLFRHLRKPTEAEVEQRRALGLRERLAADFPSVPQYRRDLAGSHHNVGRSLSDQGKHAEAETEHRRALALQKSLAAEFPAVPEYRRDVASSHWALADLLHELGKHGQAEAGYRQAIAIQKQLVAEFPNVPLSRQDLAGSHYNFGVMLKSLERRAEAEEEYRQACALNKQLVADFPAVPEFRRTLALSHNTLGNVLRDQRKHAEAATEYQEALTLCKRLAADFPGMPEYRKELARNHDALGSLLKRLRKYAEAEAEYRQALAVQQQLAADFPAAPDYRESLAWTHFNLGNLFREQDRDAETEAAYRQSLAVRKQLAADFPNVPDYRRELAASHTNLGLLLKDRKEYAEAELEYQQALALYRQLVADFPDVPGHAVGLGGSYCNFGLLVEARGQPAEAVDWFRQAIQTLTPLARREPPLPKARQFLCNSYRARAKALEKLGRWAEAVSDWERAVDFDEPPLRLDTMIERALCLARVDPARAVAAAEALIQEDQSRARSLSSAARIHAVASGLSRGEAQRENYAARAVALLRQARDRGFFKTRASIEHLKKQDAAFQPLWQREDFNRFIAELEGKRKE